MVGVGRQGGGGQGEELSSLEKVSPLLGGGGTEVSWQVGGGGGRLLGAGRMGGERAMADGQGSRLVGRDRLVGRQQAVGGAQPSRRWAGCPGSPRPHGWAAQGKGPQWGLGWPCPWDTSLPRWPRAQVSVCVSRERPSAQAQLLSPVVPAGTAL